jgi:Rhs element Vgr protein
MSPVRTIPTQASTDLPTFTVLIDGEDIGGTVGISSLMVSKSVNRIPKARLILSDGDAASGDFPISSSEQFVPGKEVEIMAGYHRREDTIFKGIITGHSIRANENKQPVLRIDLRDVTVKMTSGRKNRYFENVQDSEVIEELINTYGITAEVDETEVMHKEMVQYYTTDWDFMIARAEVNSRLVYVDDGVITVKKPDFSRDPILNLAFGHNVISFEAGMDARDQFTAANSRSWNYSEQEIIDEEADEPDVSENGNISAQDLSAVIGLDSWLQQHGGKVENTELKAWSDSKLLKSRMARIRGRVKIIGFSDIKPGDIIELENFGDRFNGPAFVSTVNHLSTTEHGWQTEIGFGLDQEWFINRYDDIVARQASGLIPPIHGLQVGVVTNIHEDPDGENRIKVRLPVIDPQNEGVWTRQAALDAGDGRGILFRPEIGDEVIVGFINDDPRDPVILGMLHSSSKPAPIDAEEDNNVKGIITRGELKLLLDDDKKSVTIETPGGNKWTMSDEDGGVTVEDKNGNKVLMSADGISLESNGDLKLKASGDVMIEGMNITESANSAYKAEGNSGAELSSGGQTVVKGSIVMIN